MSVKALGLATAVGVVALAAAATAHSASLTLNCTEYQNLTVPANCTTGATATLLTTPGAYSYADASLMPDTSSGGIIAGSTYPAGYTGASFYDAFVIQVANSQGDSISSTINLGSSFVMSNFQERLYAYNGTAPVIGPVSGAVDAWTSPAGSSGTVAVLPSTFLAAGTYILEVRGDVTGTTGGSYSGTFQLTPVPLPQALTLLVSALIGFGGVLMWRRADAHAAAQHA